MRSLAIKEVLRPGWFLSMAIIMAGCGGATGNARTTSETAVTNAAVTCSTTAFGSAQSFDVFVTGNLNQSNTDVGGSVGAGGNAVLSSYSAGSQLPPVSTRIDLLVGGNLQFTGGSLPNGSGEYGGTATIQDVSSLGGIQASVSPLSFAAAQASLTSLSAYLSELAANGTFVNSYGTLNLTGTNTTVNVFSLAASDLASANGFTVTAPAGSSVVVNVSGTAVQAENFGFTFNGTDREQTLFNLPQAQTLTMSGIGFDGTILAPATAVSFNNGQLNGQLFAASLNGTGEVEHDVLAGCIPTPPPPTCISEGSACSASSACCTGFTCQSGTCQPPPPVCEPQGGACSATSACCTGLTCQSATCQPPPPACEPEGGACSATSACCTGLTCQSATCQPPPPACEPEGGACTTSAGCCTGLACESLSCQPPSICPSGALTSLSNSGTMEGNLAISPGDALEAGYDLTIPSDTSSVGVEVSAATVTIQVTCPDGSTTLLPIAMPAATFTIANSQWYPSSSQTSSLVWQGQMTAPATLCGGQTGHATKGATFSAALSSTRAESIHVRFHYSDATGCSPGSWSGTECASTTCCSK